MAPSAEQTDFQDHLEDEYSAFASTAEHSVSLDLSEYENPGLTSTTKYSNFEYILQSEDSEEASIDEDSDFNDLLESESPSTVSHVDQYVQMSQQSSNSDSNEETIYTQPKLKLGEDEELTNGEHSCDSQDTLENEDLGLASSAIHITRDVEASQQSSSTGSKETTLGTEQHSKDVLLHTDGSSSTAPSTKAKMDLEEDENLDELFDDENLDELFEDIPTSNYGLARGSTQTEDIASPRMNDILEGHVDSSLSTAPVSEAIIRLKEDESNEALFNDEVSPNDGLYHGSEQVEEVTLPLVDGIAKAHITDRGRYTGQSEKETAEQRAEALKREKAEAAARSKEEAQLAEDARVPEEKANPEVQWLKCMGRSALPRESNILKPVAQDWQRKVHDAMTRPRSAELATDSNGNKLTKGDFKTVLEPPYWLNDNIIAAHIQPSVDKALERTRHSRGQIPKVHAFSSFFYENLSTKGPESIKRWAGKAKIGGKDLKRVDTIFIPVNPGVHWTLLVVSPSKRSIEYFDSLSGSRPSPTNNVYTDNVKKWLKQELGSEYNDSEWTVRIRNDGPQQNNGYDCGVFAITTAKLISLGYDPMGAYDVSDMPAQRIRVFAELMARDLVESDEDVRGCEIATD